MTSASRPARRSEADVRAPTADERPRRQRLSPELRRTQLIDATIQVLAARGYRHTSADAIVAYAGVSKGLLWRYFTDLDDLLESTARHALMAMARSVGQQIDMNAPAPTLMRQAVHAAADLLTTHAAERAAMNQIVPNLRASDGSPRLGLTDYAELWSAQEVAIFRRGRDDGHLRAALDPHIMAVVYQGTVDTMLNYLESHPDVDRHAYADAVADILLDGINTPAAE